MPGMPLAAGPLSAALVNEQRTVVWRDHSMPCALCLPYMGLRSHNRPTLLKPLADDGRVNGFSHRKGSEGPGRTALNDLVGCFCWEDPATGAISLRILDSLL
jgi:hypothetical protein